MTRGKRQFIIAAVSTLSVASIASIVLLQARFGWDAPITDAHGWRQAQTAITAYYMIGQPFKLAYETPLLGPPWSIPLEFPLYQVIVAILVEQTGMTLVSAARSVGLFFFMACSIPLWLLLWQIAGAKTHALCGVALFISSSFYAFWSRTVMIESTALFFSLSFLSAFVMACERRSGSCCLVAILMGSAAGLTKVTTFALFAAAALFYGAAMWLNSRKRTSSKERPCILRKASLQSLIVVFVMFGVPLAVAGWWVIYSDHLKAQNPLAALLSSKATAGWNFGTWSQKLDVVTWKLIVGRALAALGDRIPAVCLIIAAAASVLLCCRRRWELLGCLALFALGPLVFTNLYFVHDYYFNANLVFLLAALWFGCLALLESRKFAAHFAGYALALICVVVQLTDYQRRYLAVIQTNPNEENAALLSLAQNIRAETPRDSVIVWITDKPTPVVPYYAERRAVCLFPLKLDESILKAVSNLSTYNVSAIVNSTGDTNVEAVVLERLQAGGNSPVVFHAQATQ